MVQAVDALVIGHRYWMRRATKIERKALLDLEEEFCGFCRTHRDDLPVQRRGKLLVEIVPLNYPQTICCRTLEEPPPGSFAIRIIKGCRALNNQEWWCGPQFRLLLTPAEAP